MNLFLSFFFILRFSPTLKYAYVRELNIDVHIKISKNKRFNKAKFWCGVLLNNRRMKNRIFFSLPLAIWLRNVCYLLPENAVLGETVREVF